MHKAKLHQLSARELQAWCDRCHVRPRGARQAGCNDCKQMPCCGATRGPAEAQHGAQLKGNTWPAEGVAWPLAGFVQRLLMRAVQRYSSRQKNPPTLSSR